MHPRVWKNVLSPFPSTPTIVEEVWLESSRMSPADVMPCMSSWLLRNPPNVSFPTRVTAPTRKPSFPRSIPTFGTIPPVVIVIESIGCMPPGFGGAARSIGRPMTSTTETPATTTSRSRTDEGGGRFMPSTP